MMKAIETGIYVDRKEIKLCPVLMPHPVTKKMMIVLYDIYLGDVRAENWHGSRRTVSACGTVLGVPDLVERLWG